MDFLSWVRNGECVIVLLHFPELQSILQRELEFFMRVLAVIPAYNEEQCLEQTVRSLISTCPDIDYLVVNDGSSDSTESVMREHALNGTTLPINTGLSSAFRLGMKYAKRKNYDAVVQFDADGQHLPEYIPTMVNAMQRTGAEIVIASRFLDGSEKPSGARGVGSRLIALFIRMTTGARITDPTSGMRLYSRRMIELFSSSSDCAPEPDVIALVVRKYGRVTEIPAKMQERQGGESYLNMFNAVKYMLRTCLSILLMRVLK